MRTGQNVFPTLEKRIFTEHEKHEFVSPELIVLAIENTYLYPRKREFYVGILFSACPSFYSSIILSVGHSISV